MRVDSPELSIVPTALLVTSTVFACFTGASLMAPDGKYLYLAGMLSSGLSTLIWLGFINIFFRSQLLFQVHIWIGLAVFCGFIMFDTQLIIRKAKNGDKDFIAHSLDLFIDFVQVFRKVLILLMQKEGRKEKETTRRSRDKQFKTVNKEVTCCSSPT